MQCDVHMDLVWCCAVWWGCVFGFLGFGVWCVLMRGMCLSQIDNQNAKLTEQQARKVLVAIWSIRERPRLRRQLPGMWPKDWC